MCTVFFRVYAQNIFKSNVCMHMYNSECRAVSWYRHIVTYNYIKDNLAFILHCCQIKSFCLWPFVIRRFSLWEMSFYQRQSHWLHDLVWNSLEGALYLTLRMNGLRKRNLLCSHDTLWQEGVKCMWNLKKYIYNFKVR